MNPLSVILSWIYNTNTQHSIYIDLLSQHLQSKNGLTTTQRNLNTGWNYIIKLQFAVLSGLSLHSVPPSLLFRYLQSSFEPQHLMVLPLETDLSACNLSNSFSALSIFLSFVFSTDFSTLFFGFNFLC
jgi:hypothetical protein